MMLLPAFIDEDNEPSGDGNADGQDDKSEKLVAVHSLSPPRTRLAAKCRAMDKKSQTAAPIIMLMSETFGVPATL
jgi:hypothetical protein